MSNELSLLFYLATFLMSATLVSIGLRKKISFLTWIGLIMPAVISGLRYEVGTDYQTYISIYDTLASSNLVDYLSNNVHSIELGFFGIIKFAYFMHLGTPLMLGTASLLTLVFTLKGLKRLQLKRIGLVYFSYLVIMFPFTFNGVRQGIAISILFFAFTYALERRLFLYILWTLFAALFHLSALFMLPLYLVPKYVKPRALIGAIEALIKIAPLALVLVASMTIILSGSQILTLPAFQKYTEYFTTDSGTGMGQYFVTCLSFLLAASLSRKLVKQESRVGVFLALSLLSVIIATLGLTSHAIYRMSLYLSIYSVIIMSTYPDIFSDRLGKRVATVFVVVYPILYFLITYGLYNTGEVVPYRLII